MQPQEPLTPADLELERALGTLCPMGAGIDRDALMFRAGRQSLARGGQGWRISTVALTLALGASILFNAWQGSKPMEQVVVQPTAQQQQTAEPIVYLPSPSPEVPRIAQDNYLKLRSEVLAKGLDALPPPQYSQGPSEAPEQLKAFPGLPSNPPVERTPSLFTRFFNMGEGT
jgi:hypothetical protein